MSTEETKYLTQLGWSTNDYEVRLLEEIKHLLDIPGHQNYVYGIKDPKGIALFSKNHRIIKKEFYLKHIKVENETVVSDTPVQTETPAVPAKPVSPPSIPKPDESSTVVPVVPPKPPIPTSIPPVPKQAEPVDEDEALLEFISNRCDNLEQHGFVMNEECTEISKGNHKFSMEEIGDMENDVYMNFIKVVQTDKEKIEQIVKDSGVPEDKVFIGEIPKAKPEVNVEARCAEFITTVGYNWTVTEKSLTNGPMIIKLSAVKEATDEEFEKLIQKGIDHEKQQREAKLKKETPAVKEKELAKSRAEKQEPVEVKISKPEAKKIPSKVNVPVSVASEELSDEMELVDKFISVAKRFQKESYQINRIKDIIASKMEAHEKIEEIEQLLINL
jgi:hypothetical protein